MKRNHVGIGWILFVLLFGTFLTVAFGIDRRLNEGMSDPTTIGAMNTSGTNAASVVALPGSLTVGGDASFSKTISVSGLSSDATPGAVGSFDGRHARFGPAENDGIAISKASAGSAFITSVRPGAAWDPITFQGSDFRWAPAGTVGMLFDSANELIIGGADTGPERLQVTGAASISSDLSVGGNASVTGALQVNGVASVSNNLTVSGATGIYLPNGDITFGTLDKGLFSNTADGADAKFITIGGGGPPGGVTRGAGFSVVGNEFPTAGIAGDLVCFSGNAAGARISFTNGSLGEAACIDNLELRIGHTADLGDKLQVTGAASISSTLTAGGAIISSGTAPSFALANGGALDCVFSMTATESLEISVGGGQSAISIASDSKIVTFGSIMLRPQADPPTVAAEGQVYADTDHHMYYYNGTSWLQLDNAP